jgi:Fe-S-cluster containining protein
LALTMTRRVRHDDGEETALAELEALYREVDAAFAGWSCPASTECCRFGVTGREPYVTSVELALLERAVAARGGRPKASRDKRLPLANERPCPLLSSDGRCTVYASRPLGCRTFYCERADAGHGHAVAHREITAFVRAVQKIAARHRPDGDRGRPLTRAF